MHFWGLLLVDCFNVGSILTHLEGICVVKSKEFWWNWKVIRRPKSEWVLDYINKGYVIDFVSLWGSFWSPEGGSFGLAASRVSIWRLFWSLKLSPIWGLKRTNGLRGFFAEFKLSRWFIVARPHRVYILFSQNKVAFDNMNDWIHLYKSYVSCA